jgi:hypothetical protein
MLLAEMQKLVQGNKIVNDANSWTAVRSEKDEENRTVIREEMKSLMSGDEVTTNGNVWTVVRADNDGVLAAIYHKFGYDEAASLTRVEE